MARLSTSGQSGIPHLATCYVSPDDVQGSRLIIRPPESRYLTKVLRLRPGAEITAVDGLGNRYLAVLSPAASGLVEAQIKSRAQGGGEPEVNITLAQALIKGSRMDIVVEKCTELGVSRIVPMVTRRSVVQPQGTLGAARLERWRRIALTAMKQSGRSLLPLVSDVMQFDDVVKARDEYDLGLLAWEKESSTTVREALKGMPGVRDVLLVVGPEGGFEPEEAARAVSSDLTCVSLGPRRLRAETAGVVLTALVLNETGCLG